MSRVIIGNDITKKIKGNLTINSVDTAIVELQNQIGEIVQAGENVLNYGETYKIIKTINEDTGFNTLTINGVSYIDKDEYTFSPIDTLAVVIDYTTKPLNLYTIETNLTNCTINNDLANIYEGNKYSAKITETYNYLLDPSLVHIIMGGIDITDTAFNKETYQIDIENVTGDLSITVEAINIPFADATPEQVKWILQSGKASRIWSVGSEKDITLTDGYTYKVRLSDLTIGRYDYTDGTRKSNGVIEFIYTLPSQYNFYSSTLPIVYYGDSTLRNTLNSTIYNQFPDEWKAIIPQVNIVSAITPLVKNAPIDKSPNYIFIPSLFELGLVDSTTTLVSNAEYSTPWSYYSSDVASRRIRYRVTSTSTATPYVTRSNRTLDSESQGYVAGVFWYVNEYGNWNNSYSSGQSSSRYINICFAI